jgi:hypothetical protein
VTDRPVPARDPGPGAADADPGAAPHASLDGTADPHAPPARRPKRRTGGVAVVAGGLLQDLEERLRRDLAPVELRVRPGEELRGLAGGTVGGPPDPLVVVLPADDHGGPREAP